MALLGSRFKVLLLLIVLVFARATTACASISTRTQVVLIFTGGGLAGAAFGITISHLAHRSASRTGRTTSNSGALTVANEAERKTLTLVEQTGVSKSAERIRVNGKQVKTAAALFLVEKTRKDYGGACSANC